MATRCSIWLIPTKNDQAYLQNIVHGLSLEYKAPLFSPHCTLYSPIDIAKSELEEILDYVASGSSPLSVKIDKLKFTSNIWKTVLENSQQLIQLQQKLIREIPLPHQYDFSPHISLIYKSMSTRKKKGIIEKLSLKSTYKMDKISAVETGSDVINWKNITEMKLNA